MAPPMPRIEAERVTVATDFEPFDPDAAADAAGVSVSLWMGFGRLLGLYARVAGHGTIGLHFELERQAYERLRRVVLAHELCHHFTCTGIHVRPFICAADSLTTSRVEAQAARWAAMRLCPPDLVRTFVSQHEAIGLDEVLELAELVQVPEGFALWWLADLAARCVVADGHPGQVPPWIPRLVTDRE